MSKVIDFRNFQGRGWRAPSGRVVGGVVVIAVLLALSFTTTFTIDPEEEGVVTRFGRFERIVGPGLHFRLPPPVESVWKVPTQRQLKEEFGFRTVRADVRTEYSGEALDEEKLMLTGDLNVAVVEW